MSLNGNYVGTEMVKLDPTNTLIVGDRRCTCPSIWRRAPGPQQAWQSVCFDRSIGGAWLQYSASDPIDTLNIGANYPLRKVDF